MINKHPIYIISLTQAHLFNHHLQQLLNDSATNMPSMCSHNNKHFHTTTFLPSKPLEKEIEVHNVHNRTTAGRYKTVYFVRIIKRYKIMCESIECRGHRTKTTTFCAFCHKKKQTNTAPFMIYLSYSRTILYYFILLCHSGRINFISCCHLVKLRYFILSPHLHRL